MKGSLSVLKLILGTYFSQTGNPLVIPKNNNFRVEATESEETRQKVTRTMVVTRSSTQHKHKAQSEDEHIVQLCVSSSRISPNHFSLPNHTEKEQVTVKKTEHNVELKTKQKRKLLCQEKAHGDSRRHKSQSHQRLHLSPSESNLPTSNNKKVHNLKHPLMK